MCLFRKHACLFMNRGLCSLEKELTFHTCLFMKHNPIGINRGLCSLEKKHKKHKKSCGHSLELLSLEPNILVESWGQIAITL